MFCLCLCIFVSLSICLFVRLFVTRIAWQLVCLTSGNNEQSNHFDVLHFQRGPSDLTRSFINRRIIIIVIVVVVVCLVSFSLRVEVDSFELSCQLRATIRSLCNWIDFVGAKLESGHRKVFKGTQIRFAEWKTITSKANAFIR